MAVLQFLLLRLLLLKLKPLLKLLKHLPLLKSKC
jgi:hypothetical protein